MCDLRLASEKYAVCSIFSILTAAHYVFFFPTFSFIMFEDVTPLTSIVLDLATTLFTLKELGFG